MLPRTIYFRSHASRSKLSLLQVATGAANAFVSGGADGEVKLSEGSAPEFGVLDNVALLRTPLSSFFISIDIPDWLSLTFVSVHATRSLCTLRVWQSMLPGGDQSVAYSALAGSGTTLISGDEEVTALAVSPAGDELLVGLADGSVNAHALPSGTTTIL